MDRNSHDVPADALYISAKEAAELLGVAVASVYAYVGRKGIRSQPIPGTRQRRYWREDVEQVSKRGSIRSTVTPDSVVVPETRITLLTDRGPFYRGHSAVRLAGHASLEEVAALLWEHPVEEVFPLSLPAAPEGFAAARSGLANLTPREQASGLFPLLEMDNPRSYDRTSLAFCRTGGELMRWFAALIAGDAAPTGEPIHLVLARGWNAPASLIEPIRHALVLLADHELAADTYAVRAVANTGCTPHQAIVAGLIATSGHRMEQGRANSVRRLYDEIMATHDPEKPILARCRMGEQIPGFGNGPVGGWDSRARLLFSSFEQYLPDDADLKKLQRAATAAREITGLEPDIAMALVFLERKLDLTSNESFIKLSARMAGWIAHAFEQIDSNPLVRPRAAYTGTLPIDD